MKRLILLVTGLVTMMLGGVMLIASPAMADTPAGTSVYTVGSDSITLHTPTGLAYQQPDAAVWDYCISTWNCTGKSTIPFQDPMVVQLPPGTYTLTLITDQGNVVDQDQFTIGGTPSPTTVTPVAPTQNGNKVTIPSVNCVTYLVNGSPVTGTITLTKDTTVTAVPGQGCVFPDGAKDSWTFTYTAPTPPPTTDPVFDPTASISLNKDGSGMATLDNTGSSESVVFEVVVNGKVSSVTVPAGKSVKSSFTGAKCGTVVVVNALDTRLAKKSMPACVTPTPTPSPTHQPTAQPKAGDEPKPTYVAPKTGATDGGLTLTPFALMGIGGMMLVGAAGTALRRRLMN